MAVIVHWLGKDQILASDKFATWDEAERMVRLIFPNACFAPVRFPENDAVASTLAGRRFARAWESDRDRQAGVQAVAMIVE